MHILRFLLDILYPLHEEESVVNRLTCSEVMRFYIPERFTGALQVSCCFSYRDILVQQLIQEAKFSGNEHAQKLLGHVLARFIREEVQSTHKEQIVLVSMPLSAERLAERGYNQVERITDAAIVQLTGVCSAPNAITRIKSTLPQTSLSRADRLTNVRGAFAVGPDLDPSYLYIVIDDVVTTGATLRSAVTCLTQAGITKVLPIALAS